MRNRYFFLGGVRVLATIISMLAATGAQAFPNGSLSAQVLASKDLVAGIAGPITLKLTYTTAKNPTPSEIGASSILSWNSFAQGSWRLTYDGSDPYAYEPGGSEGYFSSPVMTSPNGPQAFAFYVPLYHAFDTPGIKTLNLGVRWEEDIFYRVTFPNWIGSYGDTAMNFNELGRSFNVYVHEVPEPETYAMLIGGLGLIAAWANRRRKSSKAPSFAARQQ